jgi:hypothetical protein
MASTKSAVVAHSQNSNFTSPDTTTGAPSALEVGEVEEAEMERAAGDALEAERRSSIVNCARLFNLGWAE